MNISLIILFKKNMSKKAINCENQGDTIGPGTHNSESSIESCYVTRYAKFDLELPLIVSDTYSIGNFPILGSHIILIKNIFL